MINSRNRYYFLEIMAVILLMFIAAGLRLYNLNANGLWVDELFTATNSLPNFSIVEVINRALDTPIPSPPLIFLVTHWFVKLFGVSDTVIRLPSIIAGVLSVGVIYGFGKRIFNPTVGLIAASLLTVSSFHLHHSREARYYAFLTLFAILSIWFLLESIREYGSNWWWLGFTLTSILMVYTHLFGLFVLAGEGLFIGIKIIGDLKKKDRVSIFQNPTTKKFIISGLIVSVTLLPMAEALIASASGSRGLGGGGEVDGFDLSLKFFMEMLSEFGAGKGLGLAVFISTAIWGGISNYKNYRYEILLILSVFLTPFILIIFLQPKHWFSLKYVIFILPLYLILISLGIRWLVENLTVFVSGIIGNFHDLIGQLMFLLVLGGFIFLNVNQLEKGYRQRSDYWENKVSLVNLNALQDDLIIGFVNNDIFEFYFDPKSNEQEHILVVNDLEILQDYWGASKRIWLHSYRWERNTELMEWVISQPHVRFKFFIGDIYYLGQNASQMDLLNEARNFQFPSFNSANSVILAYLELGEQDIALEIYQEVLEKFPNNGEIHYRLGLVFEGLGEYDHAVNEYAKAIRVQPNVIAYHAALGAASNATGDVAMSNLGYRGAVKLWESQYRFASGRINNQLIDLWSIFITPLNEGQ